MAAPPWAAFVCIEPDARKFRPVRPSYRHQMLEGKSYQYGLMRACSLGNKGLTNMNELLKSVEATDNPNVPDISPGDTVKVFVRIKEGNNERVQEFKGTVIRTKRGGNNASFTVRRIASNGIGVERTFLSRSPRLERVVIDRRAKVRRAKLYYLRERTGKSARLKQRFN
jgi:large subunit ribosomal protein L19